MKEIYKLVQIDVDVILENCPMLHSTYLHVAIMVTFLGYWR